MEQRVAALVDFYRRVGNERMQGIPILNAHLRVEAVGFRLAKDEAGQGATAVEGVFITPWFMSLMRLPLTLQDHRGRVGRKRVLLFGNERFDFIGAHDPLLGFHEACALFSPMTEFRNQDHARETAQAVLDQLFLPSPIPRPVTERMPTRRAFLLGGGGGATS